MYKELNARLVKDLLAYGYDHFLYSTYEACGTVVWIIATPVKLLSLPESDQKLPCVTPITMDCIDDNVTNLSVMVDMSDVRLEKDLTDTGRFR